MSARLHDGGGQMPAMDRQSSGIAMILPSRGNPEYSFEFFPPKTTEAEANLHRVFEQLTPLKPRFCSVTFGAAGSTQDKTFETALEIQQMGVECAPHLSCIASSRQQILDILTRYQEAGVRHIVALRGDMPSGTLSGGELRYASELVAFIREATGSHFHIEVACYPEVHPQAASARSDLMHFRDKVAAGANSAITQYFYNPEAYFRFMEECEALQIHIPIVPGIMPITNYSQLARFSDLCGADIPRWIRKRLEVFGDDRASIRAFGLDVVTDLCERLLAGGAPGLHFYTLNRAEASLEIWKRLGL